MKRTLIAAALLAMSSGTVFAQDTAKPAEKPVAPAKASQTLKAGDPAPAFSVETFVKGDAITGFEKGRTYVVEFWATWCGPCIAAMPHLSELQKEYKDRGLTVIGTNIWERKYNDSTLDTIKKFVDKQGDRMAYTVAYDGKAKAMDKAYMQAAGRNGIPSCFVIGKDSTIAYIGHPMYLDLVLPKVIGGTWDITKGNEEVAAVEKELNDVFKTGDAKEKAVKLDSFLVKYPFLNPQFASTKMQLQIQSGDFAGATASAKVLIEGHMKQKNAAGLNEIAWGMVDPEGGFKNPDLDLAMHAAEAAVKFTDGKDGAILDTLARVYFLKGDKAKAIEIQTKAVELAPEQMKAELEKTLAEYKK